MIFFPNLLGYGRSQFQHSRLADQAPQHAARSWQRTGENRQRTREIRFEPRQGISHRRFGSDLVDELAALVILLDINERQEAQCENDHDHGNDALLMKWKKDVSTNQMLVPSYENILLQRRRQHPPWKAQIPSRTARTTCFCVSMICSIYRTLIPRYVYIQLL